MGEYGRNGSGGRKASRHDQYDEFSGDDDMHHSGRDPGRRGKRGPERTHDDQRPRGSNDSLELRDLLLDMADSNKKEFSNIRVGQSEIQTGMRKMQADIKTIEHKVDVQGARVEQVETQLAKHADVLSDVVARLTQIEAEKGEWESKAKALERRVEVAESSPQTCR